MDRAYRGSREQFIKYTNETQQAHRTLSPSVSVASQQVAQEASQRKHSCKPPQQSWTPASHRRTHSLRTATSQGPTPSSATARATRDQPPEQQRAVRGQSPRQKATPWRTGVHRGTARESSPGARPAATKATQRHIPAPIGQITFQ